MQRAQIVRCPNCGSEAQRQFATDEHLTHTHCLANQIIRTECLVCDYLMVMRSLDGSVIEAYAPGIPSSFKPSTTSNTPSEIREEQMLVIRECTLFTLIFRHLPDQNPTDSYSLL
ncbi:hypothetical protein [Sphaerospermopsis kisseleviana]|uniref:hypothetical protein n=1 Tax=Sphaerospermopsis kisseleviana TaxID=289435 RepID=UPI000B6086E4|nr:hypothetical protein NIES73_33240 [Sphaerospermopsis kisseleviana NIES-73]